MVTIREIQEQARELRAAQGWPDAPAEERALSLVAEVGELVREVLRLARRGEGEDPAFTLRAPAARPGCGDFCFVWQGPLEALLAALRRAGAAVEAGPVERVGGRDHGRAKGTSVYTRDPDGNLLEFIVYDR